MIAELERPTQNPPKTHQRPTSAIKRQLRADFIAGLGSGPQLAYKYSLSYNTVRLWIVEDGWQKLKEGRDSAELAQLTTYPEHTPKFDLIHDAVIQPQGKAATIALHLKRIDGLLETEEDAKNIAQLMRARGDAEEQLHIALHGSKPGTMRPSTNKAQRRPSPASPVEVQEQPQIPQANVSQVSPVSVTCAPVATACSMPDDYSI